MEIYFAVSLEIYSSPRRLFFCNIALENHILLNIFNLMYLNWHSHTQGYNELMLFHSQLSLLNSYIHVHNISPFVRISTCYQVSALSYWFYFLACVAVILAVWLSLAHTVWPLFLGILISGCDVLVMRYSEPNVRTRFTQNAVCGKQYQLLFLMYWICISIMRVVPY